MKIIFFGSSDFAVGNLKALNETEEVLCVVTQPDKRKGRSLKVSSTIVKEAASSLGIKVFQPENVKTKDSIEYLKGLGADIFVVVSFGKILTKDLLNIPELYTLNVHASLLPKYRGAAPINWAIANGEKETGLTIMKMNGKMDEGDILLSDRVPIEPDDDAEALSKRLSDVAPGLLLKSLTLIKEGRAIFIKQDDSLATYASKLKKEDGLIDWNLSAQKICDRVRGFVPWPGGFTYFNKKIIKIHRAKAAQTQIVSAPGTVLELNRTGVVVAAGSDAVRIEELQLEGKRRMTAEEFINGYKELQEGVSLQCLN